MTVYGQRCCPPTACSPLPLPPLRFGRAYASLQPRVARTLLQTLLDPSKALPQHYGAVQGLSALGPRGVRAPLRRLNSPRATRGEGSFKAP